MSQATQMSMQLKTTRMTAALFISDQHGILYVTPILLDWQRRDEMLLKTRLETVKIPA